jgi:hypothetical protein
MTNENPPRFGLCDMCGHLHPVGFEGDCRDDRNRFSYESLNTLYGDDGWEESNLEEYTDEDYIAAFNTHHANDECELDTGDDGKPAVSQGADPGAWVRAWVWVSNDEIEKGE